MRPLPPRAQATAPPAAGGWLRGGLLGMALYFGAAHGEPVPVAPGAAGGTDVTPAAARLAGAIEGDTESAHAALLAAAQDGSAAAALALGNACYAARGDCHDREAALSWWRQAAAAGNADAQYNAGLIALLEGSDSDAAMALLTQAANQGHVLACFALGTRLAEQGEADAQRWLECAARAGYAPAQFNLAALLSRGEGDRNAARNWYAAAATTFAPAAAALAALPPGIDVLAEATQRDASAPAVRDLAWVLQQPADRYTVQVAAGRSGDALAALLERQASTETSAWFLHRPEAREPYSAVIGVYADYAEAQRALAALPAALRRNSPWIRRFGTLQKELRTHAAGDAPAGDAAD